MKNPYSSQSHLSIAWKRGYDEGHKDVEKLRPWITKTGYEAALKESFRLGHKDAVKENRETAKQALLEQFILFLQESGYNSAVMSLTELNQLRVELSQVELSIEAAKADASTLSTSLAGMELI